MNNMTLHVEGLGKISMADIEMAPLMFFIGDNNSGKSYLMTLIYGLMTAPFWEFLGLQGEPEYDACSAMLDSYFVEDEPDMREISTEDFVLLINLLNGILSRHKNRIASSAFNKQMHVGKLSIKMPYVPISLGIFAHREMNHTNPSYNGDFAISGMGYKPRRYSVAMGGPLSFSRMAGEEKKRFILYELIKLLLAIGMGKDETLEPLFLPVSRTGFMLTYKTLAGNSIEEKFNNVSVEKNLLTRPESDFLKKLTELRAVGDDAGNKFRAISDFITGQITNGEVNLSDGPASDILYSPRGQEKLELPLFLTSGVVTEMAPLLIFLNNGYKLNHLMMEEPEMCMHPELQKKVGQLLVRLVNHKINVMVTTHSDIILQHINSMILLNKHENKAALMDKYHYEESDMVDEDRIRVYQFKVNSSNTSTITNIECGEFGFPLSTFSDTLNDMLREAEALMED